MPSLNGHLHAEVAVSPQAGPGESTAYTFSPFRSTAWRIFFSIFS